MLRLKKKKLDEMSSCLSVTDAFSDETLPVRMLLGTEKCECHIVTNGDEILIVPDVSVRAYQDLLFQDHVAFGEGDETLTLPKKDYIVVGPEADSIDAFQMEIVKSIFAEINNAIDCGLNVATDEENKGGE